MIFVTVGTTMPFDELLAEADRLAGSGAFDGPLVCQTGQSVYRMTHCQHFRARPTIEDLIAGSSFVITHGGATVIQLLIARKPFVAFPNPLGAGDHQTSFLRQVGEVSDISWSSDIGDMHKLYTHRKAVGAAQLRSGFPRVIDLFRDGLQRN